DEGADERVEPVDLLGQVGGAPAQLAQRQAGGVVDGGAGAGPEPGGGGDEADGGQVLETGPHIVGGGPHQVADLVDGLGAVVTSGTLGHTQGADRFHDAVAALGLAGRSTGQGG